MSKKTPEELEAAIKKYSIDRKPLSMRQTRLALLDAGLLSQVEDSIASLPEPDKSKAEIEWQYAKEVYRNDDWLISLSEELGLSSSEVDDLFYNAYAL